MKSSTGEVVTKAVVIPAMSRLQDVMTWRPEKPGELQLTLHVPPTGAERFLENNTVEAPLSVRQEKLRVLVVESFPRWEYRYLRNALERDPGVEVHCVLFHPDLGKMGAGRGYLSALPKEEELAEYDVVFLGDVGVDKGQLTASSARLCKSSCAIRRPGSSSCRGCAGTRFASGHSARGADADRLGRGAAARLGRFGGGKFALTEAGTRSLLTKLEDTDEASARVWQTLPGFQWYAPAVRAKAGPKCSRRTRRRRTASGACR
jgi:hypothetical protein